MSTSGATIRLLRDGEQEALVALLDGWELPGWPGPAGAFFRRYLELDPTFAPDNVIVAEHAGRLLGCVQIFPRRLRVRRRGARGDGLAETPMGGIGSVFTHSEARGAGLASALLERAAAEMRARGFELSLLFASRHAFYGRLGWHLWPRERALWLRPEATRAAAPDPSLRIAPFDPARDLADAFALHEAYSGALEGTCVRDAAFFRAQLGFAGQPSEDFLLARDAADGTLLAFARAAAVEGVLLVTELARRAEARAAEALAELVLALLAPRDPDGLAVDCGRPSHELRRALVAPCHRDPELADALARRGAGVRSFSSRDVMVRVLDAEAFARRTGVPRAPDESEVAWLERALPPDRLVLWPADRF